jgi:prepilin-type N-terminal cleavage/methylation domain-containing protein
MLRKLRNRQRGFTLIELLIVVAIIGIIAALLIPNFLDALQKAKQKRTVADLRNVGTAHMSWLTDQLAAAAAGAGASEFDIAVYTATDATSLTEILVPQYIQSVPARDGWKNEIDYFANDLDAPGVTAFMAYRSNGRDKTTQFTSGVAEAFNPTDYDQDIVWADGFFVRWPQNMSADATP